MICATIADSDYERILAALDDPFVEMAEIRLDLCNLTDDLIEELFSTSDKPLIATCRVPGAGLDKLSIAARAGARYIDVPVTERVEVSRAAQALCRDTGAGLIRSWHSFESSPQRSYLCEIAQRCVRYGADVVKICTVCSSEEEMSELMGIYESFSGGRRNARLAAFAMGPMALESRLEALKKGAPFVYCAALEPVSPGQPSVDELHAKVYGDAGSFFRDSLRMPCSKSFAQRAIIAAALAPGTSTLRGYTPCDDSDAAVQAAKALGATVRRRGSVLTVTGPGRPVRPDVVNAGESGLLARLLIPILAQMGEDPVRIEGKGTLLRRPLKGAADIMAAFGVIASGATQRTGRELHVPLTVRGKMYPGKAEVSGADGSQLISGLLMALPRCSQGTDLYVGEPKSIPYMMITLDVLRRFGVKVAVSLEGDADSLSGGDWSSCVGADFQIRGGQRYKPAEFDLEGDWSAAAPFLVAGAVFGAAEVCGLDTESLQADISILDILVDAGACVSCGDGSVVARKGPLAAFCCNLDNCPDLFPCAAVLAAFCEGSSELSGVSRLRTKESDRLVSICAMLDGFGVPYSFAGDTLVVSGHTFDRRILCGEMLHGGTFKAFGDHRIAMAIQAASIGADGPVTIDDTGCVSKSFPEFFSYWDGIWNCRKG